MMVLIKIKVKACLGSDTIGKPYFLLDSSLAYSNISLAISL